MSRRKVKTTPLTKEDIEALNLDCVDCIVTLVGGKTPIFYKTFSIDQLLSKIKDRDQILRNHRREGAYNVEVWSGKKLILLMKLPLEPRQKPPKAKAPKAKAPKAKAEEKDPSVQALEDLFQF
jgi:hypothetical protein